MDRKSEKMIGKVAMYPTGQLFICNNGTVAILCNSDTVCTREGGICRLRTIDEYGKIKSHDLSQYANGYSLKEAI